MTKKKLTKRQQTARRVIVACCETETQDCMNDNARSVVGRACNRLVDRACIVLAELRDCNDYQRIAFAEAVAHQCDVYNFG